MPAVLFVRITSGLAQKVYARDPDTGDVWGPFVGEAATG
jgi:hypothetical protein